MAIKQSQQGFALLIAIIFMSVMLTFGLALGSIAYKQSILASDSLRSHSAFYVADAALECAFYADQQLNLFTHPPSDPGSANAPVITCDAAPAISSNEVWSSTRWVVSSRFSLDGGTHCADVTVSKPAQSTGGTTYLFAQGYDVSCATVGSPSGARFASRGLRAHY
ncbi:MAG: hypothetical protein WAW90_03495 [Minisyncoccia bacterium]